MLIRIPHSGEKIFIAKMYRKVSTGLYIRLGNDVFGNILNSS